MRGLKRKKEGCTGAWLTAAMFLLCMLLGGVLPGCVRREQVRPGETAGADAEGNRKLKVVTTLFPYYDFTRQIAGDAVELSMVIPAGMDSHSFEPTPADIRLIQSADLLICNGGAMEQWVEQVVGSLEAENLTVVTMMDHVDVVEEVVVEGMEDSGDEHNHVHGDGVEDGHVHADGTVHTDDEDSHVHADGTVHADDEDGHVHADGTVHTDEDGHVHEDESQFEIEYDEHIWTSPVNAMKIAAVIGETLAELDPANAVSYEAGAEDYVARLSALDGEFRQVVSEARHDILIMGDKFPLRYVADTYGLRYRAAFSGCSTDTEPSAKTIAYLIDKVREEEIPVVYYLELSSHRVAEIIGEETGAEPLLFHSCHNVTRREFENGVTYLELMEQNVVNLRAGLCR